MVLTQKFNKRTDQWVKIRKVEGRAAEIVDVKTREPTIPFADIAFE